MKKLIMIVLTAVFLLFLWGCGQASVEGESDTAKESASETEVQPPVESEPFQDTTKKQENGKGSEKVDIDLSEMSDTMVYSQVYTMIYSPEDYVGKTVRMKGNFMIYQGLDEDGNVIEDSMYFACAVADATACCSQGIEFVLGGDKAYPEDYPEVGEEITVEGTFGTYEELGIVYSQLENARLL